MNLCRALLLGCLIISPRAVLLALPQEVTDEVLLDSMHTLTPQDIPTLTQKAGAGDLRSQVILGWAYTAGAGVEQDYVAAAKWLQLAADSGSGLAECGLATLYTSKKGPGQDYARAMELYRKSVEQGQACGEFNLGMMYELGEGGPPNPQEAGKWYRRAAERKGYFAGKAQQFLAGLYFDGRGVKKDYRQAVKLFTQAEQSGVYDAQSEFLLGLMYADGTGVAKDEKESDSWFLKAAEHGHTKAQAIMGTGYLEEGKYPEAAKWLTKAAEAGDPDAQESLAGMYTNGQGFKQDDAEAIKWLTKAAEQGNKDALHLLGFIHCCRIPSTISEDDVASYVWFTLARCAGDKKASEFLAMLRGQMKREQIKEGERRANEWLLAHGKQPVHVEGPAGQPEKATKESTPPARALQPEAPGLKTLREAWDKGESSLGVQLAFREAKREKSDQTSGELAGKTVVTYNLVSSGFPKGKVYSLWVWTLGQEPRLVASGFSPDDTGKLTCLPAPPESKTNEKEKWCETPLESVKIGTTAARGESKRVTVLSDDSQVKAFAKIIPFPIEAKDGPCRLSIELLEPVGQAFRVSGEGFEPNEEVGVIDQSEDEVMKMKQNADASGKLTAALFPAVAGKNSGAASWTVQSKTCHLKVEYNWGKASFQWQ